MGREKGVKTPSKKKYKMDCKECGDNFFVKRKGAKYCSDVCRKDASLARIVKRNALIIDAPVEVDIQETFPPSQVGNLCTETDMWILISKITELVMEEDSSSMFSRMKTEQKVEEMVCDFEERFNCSLAAAKELHSHVVPGLNNSENWKILLNYRGMSYSK